MIKLQGCFTALVTPLKNGGLDEHALRRIVRRQLKGGINGLVPCGSTGEAATLSSFEYQRVIEITLEEAGGKVPIVPGVASNSTDKAIAGCREVAAMGVDAILLLTPYYNKPTQQGLFEHFRDCARAVDLPVIVYNIPGRTGINLEPSTLARLAKAAANITTTKEAAGSLDQVSEILSLCPPGFTVLSGDDSLTLPMMSIGAKGSISVASNVLPREMTKMIAAALKGDFAAARRQHLKLFPVFKAMFIETNPIPVKSAVQIAGLCSDEMRAPLTTITPESRRALRKILKRFKL